LVDLYNLEEKFMVSPLIGDNLKRSIFGGAGFLPVSKNKRLYLCDYDYLTFELIIHNLEGFLHAR
jgi:hypothetical protein